MIVYRKEVKYLLDILSYQKMGRLLDGVLHRDPHCLEKDYYIRSLYFDDLNEYDFHSKMNGEANRKKIRLRTYDIESDEVKLEIKRKENDQQTKESVLIGKEDAKELIRCNYSVLLKYKDKTAQTVYNIMAAGQYRPKVLVDYYRRAYIYDENAIRVTMDYDIRSSESNFELFERNLLLTPVFNENTVVLEVKYKDIFPGWLKEALGEKGFNNQSVSKYCTARTWLI